MKKLLVLLLVIVCYVAAQRPTREERYAFERFKIKFHKSYVNRQEETKAFRRFVTAYRYIKKWNNAKDKNDPEAHLLEINQFADLTDEDIFKFTSGHKLPPYEFSNFTSRPKNVITIDSTSNIPKGPTSIDWNARGQVTPVKDQGYYCNSCWAFSGIAALESALSIYSGTLRRGSEQNLIDCNYDESIGSLGCRGGSQASAYMYIQFQPGVASEESYPYDELEEHTDRFKCRYNRTTSIGTTTGYARVKGNESLIMDIVGNIGPVAFALNSNPKTFLYYSSGIYDDATCTPGTGHSALIYGYGTARNSRTGVTIDYWLCKNSWSTSWGAGGYFKMVRGKNMCGITGYVIYPLVN